MSTAVVRRLFPFLLGLSLLSPLAAAPVASAQCADPRGNSYCQNGGQVTFNPPPGQQSSAPSQPCADPRGSSFCQTGSNQNPSSGNVPAASPNQPRSQPPSNTGGANNAPPQGTTGGANNSSPAVQSNAPASPDPRVTVDPPTALAGDTVTITGQGFGGGRSAWVNLSHMVTNGGLNLGAKELSTVNISTDGSFSTSVQIPSVPSWTAGKADICVINASAQPVCAPFTLGNADQPVDNTAITPDAIIGHYQCSSAVLVGFGGSFCTGSEPILAINSDGTYAWGDEQGGWSFDGGMITFDGGLGSGTVLNRKLIVQADVPLPSEATQTVRYTYIRMNH